MMMTAKIILTKDLAAAVAPMEGITLGVAIASMNIRRCLDLLDHKWEGA